MEKCSKCLNKSDFLIKFSDLNEVWRLCSICHGAYDKPVTLMKEFLKEDFGCFPVEEITKNIINARKKRALGKSPWNNDGDNRGQDYET